MLDIHSFKTLPSTQTHLVEAIGSETLRVPVAVIAEEQSAGKGSRGNRWEGGEGNFFASVAVSVRALPEDLPLQSISIYAGWLMRESLRSLGEAVWLKWPNDLFCGGQKVGGVITQKIGEAVIIGVGVNLKKVSEKYAALPKPVPPMILLNIFLGRLERYPEWKQIFSQFEIEFELSRAFQTHHNSQEITLKDAVLLPDGTIEINGERIHSLR